MESVHIKLKQKYPERHNERSGFFFMYLCGFALMDVLIQSEGIYNEGQCKAESNSKDACEYCEYQSDDPEEELNGDQPDDTVKRKLEDQAGHTNKAPAEYFKDHIADKVISENKAGYESKACYGKNSESTDVAGRNTDDEEYSCGNAAPYE
jgi:hypothetical protein